MKAALFKKLALLLPRDAEIHTYVYMPSEEFEIVVESSGGKFAARRETYGKACAELIRVMETHKQDEV